MKPVALRARGLNLTPSAHTAPEGSMVTARNVVIQRDNVVETTRGAEVVAQRVISRIFRAGGRWFGRNATGLYSTTDDALSDWQNIHNGNATDMNRTVDAAGEVFFNTAERFDPKAPGIPLIQRAGVPQALAALYTLGATAGTAVPAGKAVAYRIVIGRRRADGSLVLGAPSTRIVVRNNEADARDVQVPAVLPPGVPESSSWFVQLYRSETADVAAEPSDELKLVGEQPTTVASGTRVVWVTDATPDGFRGAALYTNETQQGALAAGFPPPYTRDVAAFRGSMFWSAPTERARLSIWMMGEPVAGETITVAGTVYTAGANHDPASREFKVGAGTGVVERIRNAAESLVACINGYAAAFGYMNPTAVSTDPDTGAPGHIDIVGGPVDFAPDFSIAVSAPSKWVLAKGSTAAPQTTLNEIRWSAPEQPESAPLLNSVRIGSADHAARILATRDSLWALRPDGVWRFTGAGGVWDVAPFDPTLRLLGPETAVALDNAVWCLTDQGVVRVTESGVEIVSRPIEPLLAPLLAPAGRAALESGAFAAACEADHTYRLWLPTADGAACLQFNALTETWTEVPAFDAVHAVVDPSSGRLALAATDGVRLERRTMTDADAAGVGSAEVEWTAIAAGDPTAMKHWQEVTLSFSAATALKAAALGFRTEITRIEQVIDLTSAFARATGEPLAVRVLVPLETRRGAQLQLRFATEMEDSAEPPQRWELDGVALKFTTSGNGRVSR